MVGWQRTAREYTWMRDVSSPVPSGGDVFTNRRIALPPSGDVFWYLRAEGISEDELSYLTTKYFLNLASKERYSIPCDTLDGIQLWLVTLLSSKPLRKEQQEDSCAKRIAWPTIG